MLGKKVLIGLGLISVLLGGSIVRAEMTADPLKTATALRTNEHIKIDGNLSEKSWEKALPATGFHQVEPYEGQLASESTLVKILYDDEALYIGWWCYDSEPDKIVRQLTRRDRSTSSDEVHVRIDSHHDHQTAYYFAVNAAGVIRDVLIYNNIYDDDSWDAVWEANSQVHAWGWSAEYKIPYSALKFAADDEYTWGFDLSRRIARKQEYSRWQFVPSTEATGVHRYGHLTGIKGIESPGRMEILPYSVSYAETEPKRPGNTDGRKYHYNIGMDLKYAFTSTFTLDATVNPDFGQVESDQDMVNLNTYEIFYSEKRPFFLEGFEIFQTQFFRQFYSRRIGRPPEGGVKEAAYYLDYPNNTTILSAFKLTGKTRKGTS
ncbi:MAG: carbohydrate binding family 9 domain-containing protein, partial [candidate division Zixibacteria bacterium]|nr:carbohydrate binding family 9 domain-containing protein [candidate division Zixibacteria bacterium]